MNHNDDPNKTAIEMWEARKGKKWVVLEQLLRQSLEAEAKPYGPSCARTFENLGESLEKQGRYEEAIQAYENAIKLNIGASRRERITLVPFKRLDILYRRMGKYEECLKVCKNYTQYPWSDLDAWKRLQRIAKKLGRSDLVELSEKKLNPPKGNVLLGKPLPKTTNKDVEITPDDIERAKEHAAKYAPPELQAMLNAKQAVDEAF